MPVFRNGKVLYLTPKNHAHLRSTDKLRNKPAFTFQKILETVDRKIAAIHKSPITDSYSESGDKDE